MTGTEVKLTEEKLAEAKQLSKETYEKFKTRAGYYNNSPNSHLKGKLGEIAVELYFKTLELECEAIFRDLSRDRECDLLVNGHRIEVKTWSSEYWSEMGRCIAVGQLQTLTAKADSVVWCTTDYSGFGLPIVQLQGWNSIHEIQDAPIKLTGPTHGRKVQNYQFEVSSLRSITTLSEVVR